MRNYVIEFYALSKFNNEYFLERVYTDKQDEIDSLIEQGKKDNKKHLRTTDNLCVYVKTLTVLDKYVFEPQQL